MIDIYIKSNDIEIFDKKKTINNNINKATTKNFYFGAAEAEGENVKGLSLLDYFHDYLNILEQLEVGKFIFTGRKGIDTNQLYDTLQKSIYHHYRQIN